MTQTFRCENKETLVAYLYGEIGPADRQAVEAHLRVCAACAHEVQALGLTRARVAEWTSPEVASAGGLVDASWMTPESERAAGHGQDKPAFQEAKGATVHPITAGRRPGVPALELVERVAERPAPWWSRPLPAWGQVAAAAVIFATGLMLGVSQGRAVPAAPAMSAARPAEAPVPSELASRLEVLRREVADLRASGARLSAPAAAPAASANADTLREMERLIRASEVRQQEELARRTVQLVRDFDLQRKADLMQVQQAIGQIQGTTGAEVRQHRDAIGDLMRRVSQSGR